MNWSEVRAFVYEAYKGVPGFSPAQVEIQPYSYRVSFTDLTNGTSQTKNLAVAANADFIITSPYYRAGVADTDASGDVVPLVTVLITDTGSNQQFSNDQIDISTFFGQLGKAEYNLPFPRIVNGRGALTVAVTNYAVALDYDIELTFAGVLVRSYGG